MHSNVYDSMPEWMGLEGRPAIDGAFGDRAQKPAPTPGGERNEARATVLAGLILAGIVGLSGLGLVTLIGAAGIGLWQALG
ncbi:MAG: hypothetical protein ABSD74_11400 [Rhizomicrobium sp.]|jgi:hypothetical protein